MMSTIQTINYNNKFDTQLNELDIKSLSSIFDITYYKYDKNLIINKCITPCIIDCDIDYSKLPFLLMDYYVINN